MVNVTPLIWHTYGSYGLGLAADSFHALYGYMFTSQVSMLKNVSYRGADPFNTGFKRANVSMGESRITVVVGYLLVSAKRSKHLNYPLPTQHMENNHFERRLINHWSKSQKVVMTSDSEVKCDKNDLFDLLGVVHGTPFQHFVSISRVHLSPHLKQPNTKGDTYLCYLERGPMGT